MACTLAVASARRALLLLWQRGDHLAREASAEARVRDRLALGTLDYGSAANVALAALLERAQRDRVGSSVAACPASCCSAVVALPLRTPRSRGAKHGDACGVVGAAMLTAAIYSYCSRT